MISDERRLDGWKAIAAYFGRDRTTVARWARERGLPIHQLPGGKQKTVFAYCHELAEWERRNRSGDAGAAAPPPCVVDEAPLPLALAPTPLRTRRLWAAGLVLASALVAVLGVLLLDRQQPASEPLPPDAAAARDFIAARDAWAHRRPQDLETAIRLYGAVIAQQPNYAPARAGLAETWLVYREYGRVSDAEAFGKARIAADKALELDPGLASALRAEGFIDYWWDNDPAAALQAFAAALRRNDADGLTHFWLANILSDLGEFAPAERHYQRAVALLPGSQPIAVEHAWAKWQAGRDAEALATLRELKQTYPQDATISSCLSWIYLGRGDISGFAREFADFARLRGGPGIQRLASRMTAAVRNDPAHAHRIMIEDALAEIAEGGRRIRQSPAFYASSMKDREALIRLLREAVVLGERWYSRPVTRRIERDWPGDRDVQSLLSQLVPPVPNVAIP
ncbi:tetratricopeptide repeat protein [Novosphingobium lindaniclasticum]|uniref:tetratricopeptide repeat protein n=1 Tax=Novosphingobium lindaniclasticum TaxID=1329895 RepID=UPI001F3BFD86|nr:tetratricopeptide repeat protein [Novosphingobium lindaniclasticum]